MMLGARNGAWAKSGELLPYKRELAYIESYGSQYIEVGSIYGCETLSVTAAVTARPASGYCKLLGISYLSNLGDDIGVNAYKWGNNGQIDYTLNAFNEISLDKKQSGKWFVDGIPCTSGSRTDFFFTGVAENKMFCLFCASSGTHAYITESGNYQSFVGRIKSVKLNGGSLFDAIPVMSYDDEPCLYEKVSGVFFRNKGAGMFGWGELTA